jgi:GT2 family glycosyltransferase
MTPPLGAVIVNYNAGPELRRALESIDRATGGSWQAVVVDNGSTDGSEAAAMSFAQVRLVRNSENVGFARGVNQAIQDCQADRILIMNPDCQLMPDSLPPLMAVLDRDPRCAIVAPLVLDPDGSPQGNARGDPDMLTGLFGRSSVLQRTLSGLDVARRNVIAAPSGDASTTVDWVSGACMLVRRDAVVSVGGFDERYFMYWEDADLCRRLRERGHTIRFAPAASAVHRVGQSSRTAHARSVRAFHDSAYLYYSTHVAPGVLNPKRWIARVLLAIRCRWKLAWSA